MYVRLLFVCPLLAGVLALGCSKTQDVAGSGEPAGQGARDEGSSPTPPAGGAQDDAPGADASESQPAAQGEPRSGQAPVDDAASPDGTNFVAFRPQAETPTPASDDEAAKSAEEDPPSGDSDIAMLAKAIAELRASIERLEEQNRKIMTALAISDQDSGPELTDPSDAEPPEGSLAFTVLDLQEAVKHLAVEQEAMRRLIEEETMVMKPVAPVTPTHGTLIIENNTDSDQYVWVNGDARWVWARTTATVSVPVGEVSTKLTGESAKTWEIKEPDYQERIEFVQQ